MANEAMQVVALDVTRAWSAEARGAPIEVEVLDGRVHVTVEGDRDDHVICAGEKFFSAPRGRVAATGLSQGRVRVSGGQGGRVFAAPLASFARLNLRQLARHALGAALPLAMWVSLWAFFAATVTQPVAQPPQSPAASQTLQP